MPTIENMTLKQLANHYNALAAELGKPTVNKFSNRESGVRRTNELAALVVKPAKKKRGRKAIYAGKKLFPLVEVNPRQAGSHGWHSIKIILDNPGIVYEEFIKAGGLNNGLRWDIDHKFVEARDEKV